MSVCNEDKEECHVSECVCVSPAGKSWHHHHDLYPLCFFAPSPPRPSAPEGNRVDEEINALCIRFLNNFFFFSLSLLLFFLQRKHTHNVASQYLLPCHDVSLPSCRVDRAAERRVERTSYKEGTGAGNTATLMKTDFKWRKRDWALCTLALLPPRTRTCLLFFFLFCFFPHKPSF